MNPLLLSLRHTYFAHAHTLFLAPVQVELLGSDFTGNSVGVQASWNGWSYRQGGGLYVSGQTGVTLDSCNFTGNGAEYGGGACFRGNTTVAAESCLFEGNLAGWSGGGVYFVVRVATGVFFCCCRERWHW